MSLQKKKKIVSVFYFFLSSKMECSFQEIIREAKNAINTRLDMLEALINTKKIVTVDMGTNDSIFQNSLHERISTLENIVNSLKSEQIPEVVIIEKDTRNSFEEPVCEETLPNMIESKGESEDEGEGEGEGDEGDEEGEAEAEAEAEDEDEGLQLTEFTYKGMTLYHDADFKVYNLDEDGAVGDPIGIWDEKTNRIKKLS